MIKKNKNLGQHFLCDQDVIAAMMKTIGMLSPKEIYEIGPGAGALTTHLVHSCPVTAIELDQRWCRWLENNLNCPQLKLHRQDAIHYDWTVVSSADLIVGNLPYQIASELMITWVKLGVQCKAALLMMQKEVADRVMAHCGDSAYGRLTVLLATYFEVKHCLNVGPDAFDPPPKVQSTIIQLTPRQHPLCCADERAMLEIVTAAAFSQRRKKCRHGLQSLCSVEELITCGIDPNLRPQMISPAEYIHLTRWLMQKRSEYSD